jgi:hypothetical protein
MLDIERVLGEELDLQIPRKRRPVHDQRRISMKLSEPPSEYRGAFVSEWWSNFTPDTIFRRKPALLRFIATVFRP